MCRRLGMLSISFATRLKIYRVYIRPIIEFFALNLNLLNDVRATQLRLLKLLFNLPRSTASEPIFSKLQILTAEEIFEKQARTIYLRNKDLCDSLVGEDASLTRSGRPRLVDVSDSTSLQRDFFTLAMSLQLNFDVDQFARFKSAKDPTEQELKTWATKCRKRVSCIIKRSRAARLQRNARRIRRR